MLELRPLEKNHSSRKIKNVIVKVSKFPSSLEEPKYELISKHLWEKNLWYIHLFPRFLTASKINFQVSKWESAATVEWVGGKRVLVERITFEENVFESLNCYYPQQWVPSPSFPK